MSLLNEILEAWDQMDPSEQRRTVELLCQLVASAPQSGPLAPPEIHVHFLESDGDGHPAREVA